jgi:twitching motility protein PilJ
MSVVNQLKKLFAKKPPESELDSGLSLGMPDATLDPIVDEHGHEMGDYEASPASVIPAKASEEFRDEFAEGSADLITLPILGKRTVAKHQRLLQISLGSALVLLGIVTYVALSQSERVAKQLGATGQSLMQSQRLAKSVSQALVGNAQAFPDVADSSDVLAKSVRGLSSGDEQMNISALGNNYQVELEKIKPLMERAEKNAATVMLQRQILTQVGTALRLINRQSSDLLEIAEAIAALKLQQNASPNDISAAGQLVMLTQRIGKSSNEFLTVEGVSPEAVFLLGKDLNTFKDIAQGLLKGSQELRLSATRDRETKEQLDDLIALFEETREQAGAILGNLQGLVAAREAQTSIVSDSEPLRRTLEELQDKLSSNAGLGAGALLALIAAAGLAGISALGLSRVQLLDSRQRQVAAEVQRLDAERQEQEAKRVNDANQAAILRLMNELQMVAEGI